MAFSFYYSTGSLRSFPVFTKARFSPTYSTFLHLSLTFTSSLENFRPVFTFFGVHLYLHHSSPSCDLNVPEVQLLLHLLQGPPLLAFIPDPKDDPNFNSSDIEFEDPDASTNEEKYKQWKQPGETGTQSITGFYFKL